MERFLTGYSALYRSVLGSGLRVNEQLRADHTREHGLLPDVQH